MPKPAEQPVPYDAHAERVRRERERDQRLDVSRSSDLLTPEPIVKWPAEQAFGRGPTVKTVDLEQWHRDREARERAEQRAKANNGPSAA